MFYGIRMWKRFSKTNLGINNIQREMLVFMDKIGYSFESAMINVTISYTNRCRWELDTANDQLKVDSFSFFFFFGSQ